MVTYIMKQPVREVSKSILTCPSYLPNSQFQINVIPELNKYAYIHDVQFWIDKPGQCWQNKWNVSLYKYPVCTHTVLIHLQC